jgi:hypothetical protein
MSGCAGCGRPLQGDPGGPAIRDGGVPYHLACAPVPLLLAASEEYRAIVRKGVRYFLEKYGDGTTEGEDLVRRFLDLGRAVEAERERRGPR